MRKILLLGVLPLISWKGDPKIAPYMQRQLDSLSQRPGTRIYNSGDTTVVYYIDQGKNKTWTIITTPVRIKTTNSETLPSIGTKS